MMGKDSYMKMNDIRTFPNTNHKNKLKMDKNINVRPDTTKFLEENIGRTLFDKNCSKISFDPHLRVMEIKTKINKWGLIKLKCFCTANETIKLLEENIGKTLFDINHSKIIYDTPPRIMEIKTKINKWGLIESFCTAKETISKVKRQPSEWKKIVVNETTDKGLISKI